MSRIAARGALLPSYTARHRSSSHKARRGWVLATTPPASGRTRTAVTRFWCRGISGRGRVRLRCRLSGPPWNLCRESSHRPNSRRTPESSTRIPARVWDASRRRRGGVPVGRRRTTAVPNVQEHQERVVLMRTAVHEARSAVAPVAVSDTALWQHGATLTERHPINPLTGGCGNPGCRAATRGSCWVRPLAQRLMDASCGSWVQRWTARHDARSCGLPVLDGVTVPAIVEVRQA